MIQRLNRIAPSLPACNVLPHLERIAQIKFDDTIASITVENLQPGLERLFPQLGDKHPRCRQPSFPGGLALLKGLCGLGDDKDALMAAFRRDWLDWLCDELAALATVDLSGHVGVGCSCIA